MDNDQHTLAQRLAEIVTSRLPCFRARFSPILVWPTIHSGWAAILHHAHYATVQPGETAPPGVNVTYPHDTEHPLAVDGADVAAALHAQAQDLEQTGEVGGLPVNPVAVAPWTAPDGPPSPGWTIVTPSGSDAERRARERRIEQDGPPGLPGTTPC